MDDQRIRNRIVEKMLLNGPITGGNKTTIDTAVNKYLPSHEQGRGKMLIDEMLSDRPSPIEGYGGGGRQNIHLVSVEAAVKYLKDNDGNVPFGYD
jgi:hypothetical protein